MNCVSNNIQSEIKTKDNIKSANILVELPQLDTLKIIYKDLDVP